MRKVLGVLLLVVIGLVGRERRRRWPSRRSASSWRTGLECWTKTLSLPAVQAIEFYQPTKVAVYTYNGSASDNLNEEVLRFARAEHPEWISEDGQKWADGLFIFALDPVGRHVGTYMGEDRKVSPEQREDIQNASKELLRDAQWTDGHHRRNPARRGTDQPAVVPVHGLPRRCVDGGGRRRRGRCHRG